MNAGEHLALSPSPLDVMYCCGESEKSFTSPSEFLKEKVMFGWVSWVISEHAPPLNFDMIVLNSEVSAVKNVVPVSTMAFGYLLNSLVLS